MPMKPSEFKSLMETAATRNAGKTREALRLILVEEKTWVQAQRATGVHASTIMRAMQRLGEYYCPTCGRLIKH